MTATDERHGKNPPEKKFALNRTNYKFMLIGIGVVILGFILMLGGGSDDPKEFSDAIFSFRRITLAPIVSLIGYGIIFYAILRKDSSAEV